ncbi:Uncharacterized protein conserved in bacteria [Legionella busanensis]|uniref:Uncharacterized protein conserved in bacteria n=1 Tax=Legionella busanensis TaxID=190655 RepID=A0A378KAF2_9GAMM|nr:type II toxin-antitoxin system RelE/ParE family toxin [Legionella busanensis]STX81697.1 Uncharacterized protein conserved in bacteria [Legionella busanensis]
MRIFKNKWFNKFAKKEKISDKKLCEIVKNLEKGLIDVDYGGGVIKQRLARLNQGKSSGYRCIILFRFNEKTFFVYGFPKNERDNISLDEERAFKDLSEQMFNFTDKEIDKLINTGTLIEVNYA